MASEMRRVARSLVESRSASFASRYPRAESEARLAKALAGFAPRRMRYDTAWQEAPEGVRLDVQFRPTRGNDLFLKSMSLVLTLLLASSAWALISADEGPTVRFLVPLGTVLGILAFPFAAAALGSQREAEESRVRRAIKRALVDEEES